MSVMQPNLPYALDALGPHVSVSSTSLGYQRYHRLAVDTLNARIVDSPYADKALDQIIDLARRLSDDAVLEDACETWNYGFYWQCMSPSGGGEPTGMLATMIVHQFGSLAKFRKRFIAAARRYAGSGWLWLAWSPKGLSVHFTEDGESLAGTSFTPLIVLSLSRHAYLHDYPNDAGAYAETFLQRLANWDIATAMLDDNPYQKAA